MDGCCRVQCLVLSSRYLHPEYTYTESWSVGFDRETRSLRGLYLLMAKGAPTARSCAVSHCAELDLLIQPGVSFACEHFVLRLGSIMIIPSSAFHRRANLKFGHGNRCPNEI